MSQSLPKATITRREHITYDLWKIWLDPEAPFKFKPGQYCTIGYNGIERAYSIVSSPYEEQIELLIELVPPPDGNLTPLLHKLEVGCQVTLRPRAKGNLTLDKRYSHHLMMATVTGVAPYISILRSYLQDLGSGHKFYVLHGASYADEFAYDKELQEMAQAHPDFIAYFPTISRPAEERNQGWQGETGRVNTLLEKYVERFGLHRDNTLIYACGHPEMIKNVKVRAAVLDFRVQEERFWKES